MRTRMSIRTIVAAADPGLHFGSGDVAPTGVIYLSSPRDILAVFNENGSFMPSRTHYFNLLIFPS
jgi:hypothetical protein